jgi:hypothetical protein
MQAQPQSVPPKIKAITSPGPGWFVVAVVSAAILVAGTMLYFFNPSTHGFYPVCQFHRLTGWNCPGCGGTRSAYALLHGNLPLALRDNALFVVLLAAAAGRGLWFAARRIRRQPSGKFLPANILWVVLAIAAVFTVLRNLPAFAFLSP